MTIDLNYWYLYLLDYWYLFGLTTLGVIVFGGCWWLWWFFPKKQAYRLGLILGDAKARADVEDNFRKTIGQLFGGIAVLIGAGFAYIQFSQQQQASHELLISNQVSKGFEQLGSDITVVRLGGIYALEGVMNTSDQYHVPVLEALCAFVRDNIGAKTPGPRNDESITTDIQAVLTVIGRRADGAGQVDLAGAKIPSADLNHADLSGADLSCADLLVARHDDGEAIGRWDLSCADLRGANLIYANLSNADLSGAHLNAAHLDGANLSNADLSGAHLDAAHLDGANLIYAHLDGANLSNANLDGANLSNANLDGANLIYAHLNGAKLFGAYLSNAYLRFADLSGAHLDGADLSGFVGLSQTQLSSACGVPAILPPGLTPPEPCR